MASFANRTFSLKEISFLSDTSVCPEHETKTIGAISALDDAGPSSLTFFAESFLGNVSYKEKLLNTKAAACFVSAKHAALVPQGTAALITDHPFKALDKISHLFFNIDKKPDGEYIDKSAHIHPSAKIGKNCRIEAGAAICESVTIGDNCWIHHNSVIGPFTTAGNNLTVEPLASIVNSTIGSDVYIKSGARIGQNGFGFSPTALGPVDMPHFGKVSIHDNVRIGSNACIDRGTFSDTVIGSGTRIDNMVQIGHNVHIGDNVIICGHVGIAGSSHIENGCCLGGNVGVAGHLTLAIGTMVAAMSGVARSSSPGDVLAGIPAIPISEWRRQVARRRIKK